MSDTYIYVAILITAVATYLPRFLGVFSSDFVNEDGKLFKFVSCISYGILAALISRILNLKLPLLHKPWETGHLNLKTFKVLSV